MFKNREIANKVMLDNRNRIALWPLKMFQKFLITQEMHTKCNLEKMVTPIIVKTDSDKDYLRMLHARRTCIRNEVFIYSQSNLPHISNYKRKKLY